jgi:hypothetical protein
MEHDLPYAVINYDGDAEGVEVCCVYLAMACSEGTDAEGNGPLILRADRWGPRGPGYGYEPADQWWFNSPLADIETSTALPEILPMPRFCPWCGAPNQLMWSVPSRQSR